MPPFRMETEALSQQLLARAGWACRGPLRRVCLLSDSKSAWQGLCQPLGPSPIMVSRREGGQVSCAAVQNLRP